VSTQAYVVAQNSSSAIEFADKADGQRLVDSLQRLERVRYACLYTQPDRALLVGYQRDAGDSCPAMLPAVIGVNPGSSKRSARSCRRRNMSAIC
jgi:hypothetical protein